MTFRPKVDCTIGEPPASSTVAVAMPLATSASPAAGSASGSGLLALDVHGLRVASTVPSLNLSRYSPINNRARAWSYSGSTALSRSVFHSSYLLSLRNCQQQLQPAQSAQLQGHHSEHHLPLAASAAGPKNDTNTNTFLSERSQMSRRDELPLQPQMRARALSETGRQLFTGMYFSSVDAEQDGSSHDGHTLAAMWKKERQAQLAATQAATNIDTSNSTKKIKQKKNATRKKQQKTVTNRFAFMGSDDEEETADAYKSLISRNVVSHPNDSRHKHLTLNPGTKAFDSIEECYLGGEEDKALDEWETVPKKAPRIKRAKPKFPPMSPKQQQQQQQYNSWSDDDDLHDLQQNTFGARQLGSNKKSMQFKAAQARNYAINKRDRQRGRG